MIKGGKNWHEMKELKKKEEEFQRWPLWNPGESTTLIYSSHGSALLEMTRLLKGTTMKDVPSFRRKHYILHVEPTFNCKQHS